MAAPWGRRDSVWSKRKLVFPGKRGKCARKPCGINAIRADLIFRGAHQECSHNPNEISAFPPELVFRQIPGKLPQRGRQSQWLRRLFLRTPLLNPVARAVFRVLRTPVRLRPLPPRRLAFRITACMLTRSYPRVGTEPVVTDGARSFPGRGHSASSSPVPCPMPR